MSKMVIFFTGNTFYLPHHLLGRGEFYDYESASYLELKCALRKMMPVMQVGGGKASDQR